jgi:uncharacterized protein YndB with AHSA1/START domain
MRANNRRALENLAQRPYGNGKVWSIVVAGRPGRRTTKIDHTRATSAPACVGTKLERMKKGTTGQARLHINASPETLYDLVSDVTRMGEWSPETKGCRWLDGASEPVVGARFRGTNRRGLLRWSNKSRVIAAEPGREFAFITGLMGLGRDMTKWRYRFEPADGGTEVTESFEMVNDRPWVMSFGDRLARIEDRKADLEAAMAHTLERIKAVAERPA